MDFNSGMKMIKLFCVCVCVRADDECHRDSSSSNAIGMNFKHTGAADFQGGNNNDGPSPQ